MQIWKNLVRDDPYLDFTSKQIHSLWTGVNEHKWKRDKEQILSARKVLQEAEELRKDIRVLNIPEEPGMVTIAFALEESLRIVAPETTCIALDGTCEYSRLLICIHTHKLILTAVI